MPTLKAQLAAMTAARFFSTSLHHAEACTYWSPTEDPEVEAGTSVSACVVDRGQDAEFVDREQTRHRGDALLPKATVTLTTTRSGYWGVLQDLAGNRWTVCEILGETTALYKVRLERLAVHRLGTLKREGR